MYPEGNNSMAYIKIDTPVGTEFTGKLKTATQERINKFSGGLPKDLGWPYKNIHTDVDYARNCGLPERVASGPMREGHLVELMIDLFGDNWLIGGEMSLKFIAYVLPGDALLPMASIKSKIPSSSGTKFILDVWCENQHGNKVVLGSAVGWIP